MFSLAITILNVSVLISTIGLQEGAPRCIAYARGLSDAPKAHSLVAVSFQASLLTSICMSIIIFAAAHLLSTAVFDEPDLSYPLKIVALGIPFFTLIDVLTSVFRGYDDLRPRVYFREILRNVSFTIFLLPVIFMKPSFDIVFYAYLGSIIVTVVSLAFHTARTAPFPIRIVARISRTPDVKELILFSLPLFGMAFLGFIIGWIDTIMLGIFKNVTDVGLYNGAHTIAVLIIMPLTALNLIYLPVASRMHAQGLTPEIRRGFSVVTKWLCLATAPILLILVLFPGTVLSSLFGASYETAADAFRILMLGYFARNLFGPGDALMIALGEVRFVMWSTLVAATVNVLLNLALIPPMGIEGAAIASAVALVTVRIMLGWRLYVLIKANPFSPNLLKTIALSSVIVLVARFALGGLAINWWHLPIVLISCYCLFGIVLTLTRSFDEEDISMLLAMEDRTGINASFVKRLLRRFV